MVRIAVTGAGGFIGRMLLRALESRQSLMLDGTESAIDRIIATDITAPPLEVQAALDPRVVPVAGSLDDPAVLARIADAAPDLVIHLAAVVSGQAEADFDIGMKVNLQGTIALIDLCRGLPRPPVFLFSSSVAVFSCASNDTITEDALPAPRSSYGTQKLMGELLVRDATRRGFLRGRSLRFPTISVRPGAPNKAASGFASGIIREPLAGQEAVLPVGRGLRLHLASPAKALEQALAGCALSQAALGGETTITLPGLSVTVGEMIDTLASRAGAEVAARIRPEPDPAIEGIVASWPGEIVTPRARALGFTPNHSFAELVDEHVAKQAGATDPSKGGGKQTD